MSDREKSTRLESPAPPEPPPEEFHDPETERPFREAFARRLPPDKRHELVLDVNYFCAAATIRPVHPSLLS